MKAFGYAGAQLYGMRQGPYSVVVCAPNRKTAEEAFNKFLESRRGSFGQSRTIRVTKSLNDRPLLWAAVDVSGDLEKLARMREAGWEIGDDGDPYQPNDM